ncbi:MAG: hypothetical protein ABIT07_02005, partial [Ferruginibacter sp.]
MKKYLTLVLSCSIIAASCVAQVKTRPIARLSNLSDSALLDNVQHQTFKYFWDFASPVSNMARERSNEAYG